MAENQNTSSTESALEVTETPKNFNDTPSYTPIVNKSKVPVVYGKWTCPECNAENPVSRGSRTECGTYK